MRLQNEAAAEVGQDQGSGAEKSTKSNIQNISSRHRLQVWRCRLERCTADLAAIADWKDDLETRIRRAHLIFELADVDVDIHALADEVHAFRLVCAGLAGEWPAEMAVAA